MLITNGRVVTFGEANEIIENGAVRVEGDRITDVGPSGQAGGGLSRRRGGGRRRAVDHARQHLRPHPLLRRLCPGHGHPRRRAPRLSRDPGQAVVAAGQGAVDGGRRVQRPGLPGGRHQARHDDAHRPPRQPQRHRRLAGRHRRGGAASRRCGPACATKSPTATAPSAPRPAFDENVRFAKSQSTSHKSHSGRLLWPARLPHPLRRDPGRLRRRRRGAGHRLSHPRRRGGRPTRRTACARAGCASSSGCTTRASWVPRASWSTASTSTPGRWSSCATPAPGSPTSRAPT